MKGLGSPIPPAALPQLREKRLWSQPTGSPSRGRAGHQQLSARLGSPRLWGIKGFVLDRGPFAVSPPKHSGYNLHMSYRGGNAPGRPPGGSFQMCQKWRAAGVG